MLYSSFFLCWIMLNAYFSLEWNLARSKTTAQNVEQPRDQIERASSPLYFKCARSAVHKNVRFLAYNFELGYINRLSKKFLACKIRNMSGESWLCWGRKCQGQWLKRSSRYKPWQRSFRRCTSTLIVKDETKLTAREFTCLILNHEVRSRTWHFQVYIKKSMVSSFLQHRHI